MSNTRNREYQFNPRKIKLFNPALIYGFDPETIADPNASLYRQGIHASMQFLDMQTAYLYAQDVIIPALRSNPEAVTVKQLLQWNQELHQRIAATLAKDQEFIAGNYSEKILTRWHQGREFGHAVAFYLKEREYGKLAQQAQKWQVTQQTCKTFVDILNKYSFKSITQLAEAMNNGRFSATEMQVITSIVKTGTHPKDITPKMEEYFIHFKKIITSKPKNRTEASEIAFYAFNGYVQVHPFDGANGRLATLWMNIALVLCGFSSILLRLPKERFDKNSAYKKAIDAIDSHPKLLKQHIDQRLREPKFTNRILERAIIAQVLCTEAGMALEQENPDTKKIEQLFLSKFHQKKGIFKSMSTLTEDRELMEILSTMPIAAEDDMDKMNLILAADNTRKTFENMLKQKFGTSGPSSTVTKSIEPHELMLKEIKAYLATSRIEDKAVAFISAIDKREYSKALRIVASIDHAYEAEGLKLIKIMYTYKTDLKLNALERAGNKKLCALDYAEQKGNVDILKFLRNEHKAELALINKATTVLQSHYRGHQARHLFTKMRLNKAEQTIQELQQAIQEASTNRDFEKVVELGKLALNMQSRVESYKKPSYQ